MAKVETMKGLQIFIKKIRAANTPEEKDDIVAKEFAKIRNRFGGTSKVSAYDKKKCIWKLLYAHMMGYEVDFGHKQAADLIPSSKYDEKQVGYQALTILLNENDEFMTLLVNNVLKDLESSVEPFQALALCFAGAVAGTEMSTAIAQSVVKILVNERISEVVRKKAALCLLRVYRKLPIDAGIIEPEVWAPRLDLLLQNRSLGLKLSIMGLVNGILDRSSAGYAHLLQPRIVSILGDLIENRSTAARDYAYYGLPSPWLQVKCLRALQAFGIPSDPIVLDKIHHFLGIILEKYSMGRLSNLNNAQNAVLFEAVTIALHLDLTSLLAQCVQKVASFTANREANSRYVALEAMSRLGQVPEMREAIKASLDRVYDCLHDPDVSIRKRAVNVLYMICERDSAEEIVGAMLRHVAVVDLTIKEDLVLKVAILAERYAPSISWYIDTVLSLMDSGAQEVNDDVWQRAVHLITNNTEMQKYSANNIVKRMDGGTFSVPLINTAGYVLSEYAPALSATHSPLDILKMLVVRFRSCPPPTRRLILSSTIKLYLHAPEDQELKNITQDLLLRCSTSQDMELQQRAVEYLALSRLPLEQAQMVFAPMPPWPERESSLLRRLHQRQPDESIRQVSQAAPSHDTSPREDVPDTVSPVCEHTQEIVQEPSPEKVEAPVEVPVVPKAAENLLIDENDEEGFFDPAAAPPNGNSPAPDMMSMEGDFFGPPASTTPAHADPSDDLLSLMGPPTPSPPPASAPSTSQVPPAPHNREAGVASARPVRMDNPTAAWPQLLLTGKGVLLEDTLLQVGWTSQVTGSQCMATLYLGNKGSVSLNNLLFTVPGSPSLSNFVQGDVPTMLLPQQQVQVPILFVCHGPIIEPPQLQLQYNVWPELMSYSCAVPVTSGRFLTPDLAITSDRFFGFWNNPRPNPACKSSGMIQCGMPLTPDMLRQRMDLLGFSPGAQLMDPNPGNFAGAAVFVASSSANIVHQQVITRVEVNPANLANCLVTVITDNPDLSLAFKTWVSTGLSVMI